MKVDIDKLYERINKKWIGYLYGYFIFFLFFSLGVIVGNNQIIWLFKVSIWLFYISYIIVLPITLIRSFKRDKNNKKEKEVSF